MEGLIGVRRGKVYTVQLLYRKNPTTNGIPPTTVAERKRNETV